MLNETFEPRFSIELTKSSGYFARPFSSGGAVGAGERRASSRRNVGVEYTVECPYCNKHFKRTMYDTRLNEHKDRYGNPCYGRVGYIV
jgi:hypothetical protein